MREVRCIFQGGGAKLVTLLAAAEVLEEYEASGKISVKEVAGTSAGAIAAYAFAHIKPMETLRSRMKASAQGLVEHFSSMPGRFRMMYSIYKGNPIFDEEKLHRFLRDTFSETKSDRLKISDARIPVYIRVSDIKNGRNHTYKPSDNIGIEDALSDSCAIPLVFRSHSSNSQYVDGGITSNLVGHEIFSQPAANVIAFSFPQGDPYKFKDVKSYFTSITSTAIDASIFEARSKIEEKGGFVCNLPNDFKTFDFKEALHKGLDEDNFKATKTLIRVEIDKALRHFERKDEELDLEKDLKRVQIFANTIIRKAAEVFSYSVSHCSIVCIAQSFESSREERRDIVLKEVSILSKSDGIFSFRLGIGRQEAYDLGRDIRWDVRDRNGKSLSATHEVVESVQGGSRVWHSCFVLDEQLPAALTPIKVKLMTSHLGLMKELLTGGTEWARAVCSQEDSVQKQDFVFAYPKKSGTFMMTDLLENYRRASQKPDNLADMESAWCTGTKMEKSDLECYVRESLNFSHYEYIGWRCQNMQPMMYGGALIERVS